MRKADFDIINSAALAALEQILQHWFPNGKKSGHEWELGSLAGEAGQSLKIHLAGAKRGVWSDFSSGESGSDVIALVAAAENCSQGDAARKLADFLGIVIKESKKKKPGTEEGGNTREKAPAPDSKTKLSGSAETAKSKTTAWNAIMPIPDDAPEAPAMHYKHGTPDIWHTYHDASGRVLGYVGRFEAKPPNRPRKEFAWLVFAQNDSSGRREWRWQGFPVPRPLYGLNELARHTGHPVFLVEGEKATDAARTLLPGRAVVSWPGGGKAIDKASFMPLCGADVILWPDTDKPGHDAMDKAGALLRVAGAASIRVLNCEIFARLAPGGK